MCNKKINTLQRIKIYLDFKGINNKKFEESVGFSNGAFASQLKNNKTIGVDKLENILLIYSDINLEWLLTGEGSMLKEDSVISIEADEIINKSNVASNLDYQTKYYETLEKLTKAQSEIIDYQDKYIKAQIEISKLLDEIDYLKDQGGDIVVGA